MPINKNPFKAVFTALALLAFMSISDSIQAQTYYRVSFPNRNGHLFQIEARFEGKLGPSEKVCLPVWTPGSYLVRDYSKNIERISALDAQGQPMRLLRDTKACWIAECKGRPFTVIYTFYANELAIRNAHLDATHAFFTPASLLIYSPSLMNQPHTVEFDLPQEWPTVSVALPQAPGKPQGRAFTAQDYDELADSPFEIGSHKEQTFDVDGCRYRLATYHAGGGPTAFSPEHLDKMSRIVHQANLVFGGTPPIKEYLFINLLSPSGGGGLEHKASVVMGVSMNLLNDEKTMDDFYSLVAHEYFHVWNVKRIKPERLGPFDYQGENHTTMLWFSEGFTAYYDDLLTARAGVYSPERYLQALGGNLSATKNTYGNRVQSLSDASFEAWIKYYKPNENRDNATVSYYTQGAMFGFATDMLIRKATKGKKSLDDVMRTLWAKAQASPSFYVNPETFKAALSEAAGQDMSDWVRLYTETPSVPNFEAIMKEMGIPFENRFNAGTPFLGVQTQKQGDRIVVSAVRRESPAERAGICYGDVITAINGKPLTEVLNLETLGLHAGDQITIDLAHFGRAGQFQIRLEPTPYVSYNLTAPKKTPAMLEGWMSL